MTSTTSMQRCRRAQTGADKKRQKLGQLGTSWNILGFGAPVTPWCQLGLAWVPPPGGVPRGSWPRATAAQRPGLRAAKRTGPQLLGDVLRSHKLQVRSHDHTRRTSHFGDLIALLLALSSRAAPRRRSLAVTSRPWPFSSLRTSTPLEADDSGCLLGVHSEASDLVS